MNISADAEALAWTRMERNLTGISYFGAHNPKSKPTRREIPVGQVDGIRAASSIILEVSPRLGLPSSPDLYKWDKFSDIFFERRTIEGIVTKPIIFSAREFSSRLGRVAGGALYKEIQEWGERLAATVIYSKGVIYHKGQRRYIDTDDKVFRKFTRLGGKKNGGGEVMFEVTLEDWILANMNLLHVYRKDASAQEKLKGDMARILFEHLHTWFHASKGSPVSPSYALICKKLNVSEYKYESKIKSTVGRAFDDLKSIGYLESWKLEDMTTEPGKKFVLVAGKELLRVLKLSQRKVVTSGGFEGVIEDSPVVLELMAVGVSRAAAVELSKLGSSEELLDKIDYINAQIAMKKGAIYNPAGFMVDALRNCISVPADFVTSRKRKEIVESQLRQRELQQQELLNSLAYDEWRSEQVKAVLSKMYTPTELEAELEKRLPQLTAMHPSMKRATREQKLKVAKQVVEREIRDKLDLPTLEQWVEMDNFKNFQPSLPYQ